MDDVFKKIIDNAEKSTYDDLVSFIEQVKQTYAFFRFTSMRYAGEVPHGDDWGEKELLDALEKIRQSKLKSSE